MLLDEIETFSRKQMKTRITSAIGYFNMGWAGLGWVAMQLPSKRKADPVAAAAASLLHWFTKVYEVADRDKNDFISAASTIYMCATGVVGLSLANNAIFGANLVAARR